MTCEFKKFTAGVLFDAQRSMYPSRMMGFSGGEAEYSSVTSSYFGFVTNQSVRLFRRGQPPIEVSTGSYFCVPGDFSLQGDGTAIVIERTGFRGLFLLGGPIEASGRLCYIDNCSTTQLIPPVRLGDPTFQALYFPANIDQSLHIHPTLRFGFVFSGHGQCKLGDGPRLKLQPGDTFFLPERVVHGFQSESEGMVVIAYHPDSDVGPTDQVHPMLSRTYVQTQKV